MRVLDAILLFFREHLDIFFLLICLFFVAFPQPGASPSPEGEGEASKKAPHDV